MKLTRTTSRSRAADARARAGFTLAEILEPLALLFPRRVVFLRRQEVAGPGLAEIVDEDRQEHGVAVVGRLGLDRPRQEIEADQQGSERMCRHGLDREADAALPPAAARQ